MTTLQKPDGSLTSDLNETLKVMNDHLTPNDGQSDDTDHHKRIRNLYTELHPRISKKRHRPEAQKGAWEDGITGEIHQFTKRSLHLFTQYTRA